MKNNKKDNFTLIENNKIEAKVPNDGLKKEDFEFAKDHDYKHDRKFETRPTTFLKDSLKRFKKNKSSVVAAWILGILILLAIFIPVIDRNDVKSSSPDRVYLLPKLFPSGTGWWDGCTTYTNIPAVQNEKGEWIPDPDSYSLSGVSKLTVNEDTYVNNYHKLNRGGTVEITGDYAQKTFIDAYIETNDKCGFDSTFANDVTFTFTDCAGDEPDDFVFIPYRIDFAYVGADSEIVKIPIYPTNPNLFSTNYTFNETIHVSDIVNEGRTPQAYSTGRIRITLDKSKILDNDTKYGILLNSAVLSTNSTNEEYKNLFECQSFTDANEFIGRPINVDSARNPKFWSSSGFRYLWHALRKTVNFYYDSYEATFGYKTRVLGQDEMKKYSKEGYIEYKLDKVNGGIDVSSIKILNESKCPIVIDEGKTPEQCITKTISKGAGGVTTYDYTCKIIYYKYLGYSSMPIYLMGTDVLGRDMLKYVFEGLRTSLILGIITSAICFIFGLVWGAISGYFGGTTDLVMERVTDILSGLPWIVIMTLCIIHLGSNFFVFALSLCLTGWIGTASLTRTQFYRFKNREYILASRTLGSSDMRLIFKHILPNAMGTIITSSVLMIPGVIFSEATISYLGLGLKGMSSLGVILSSNQAQLLLHPYLLIFPSVIIALLMITFNLFGNGLRDAINPSLKGEGEQ